jgi:hypothetical protein
MSGNQTYYYSPAWYRRCDKVKARSRRCEYCGRQWVQHVHHRTYEHFGREPLYDLMGVCIPCHELIHGLRNRVTIAEGSLADMGDRGMGDSALWRDYLAQRRRTWENDHAL